MEVPDRKVSRTGERIMLTIKHEDRPDTFEVWSLGDESCDLVKAVADWIYAVELLIGL